MFALLQKPVFTLKNLVSPSDISLSGDYSEKIEYLFRKCSEYQEDISLIIEVNFGSVYQARHSNAVNQVTLWRLRPDRFPKIVMISGSFPQTRTILGEDQIENLSGLAYIENCWPVLLLLDRGVVMVILVKNLER